MAISLRRGLLGISAVAVSVVALAGCTTGCAGSSSAQAAGSIHTVVLASPEYRCTGPGPELLKLWSDFTKAVFE